MSREHLLLAEATIEQIAEELDARPVTFVLAVSDLRNVEQSHKPINWRMFLTGCSCCLNRLLRLGLKELKGTYDD